VRSPYRAGNLPFGRISPSSRGLNALTSKLLLRSRFLLAALSGLVMASAFPRVGLAGFAWIAPGLMLACAHGRSGAEAWRIGYVAGLAQWLALLSWLLQIPVTGFPILGWVAMSAFLALYPAAWVWLLAGRIGTGGWMRRCAWTLAGAAAWVALEMIRARLFSGFPWNNLGASQWQLTPLIQIAAVTGVYGVSFLIAWTSLAMFSGVLAVFRQPTARYVWMSEMLLPLVVVMLVFTLGLSRVRHAPAANDTLRVTFVQPAIPQTMIWDRSENTNRLRQLLAQTEQALTNQTDLLLWPEAALPEFNQTSFEAITNLIAAHRVWMIFGADDVVPKRNPTPDEPYDYYNAAFLFNPRGEFTGVYHKRQLVMFGEYIPLLKVLPFVKWFTPITGGFTSGERVTHFELERRPPARHVSTNEFQNAGSETGAPVRLKTAALICFEDTFPHLVREHVDADTDFLVNLTNDGWFRESAAQWQHATTAAFRAVENGVPLLRCCNNGLTCWFDSRGRMRELFRDARQSEYGPGFVTWEIPVTADAASRVPTFYNRHGDWFGWSCVVAASSLLSCAFLWRFTAGWFRRRR
jgi:apolipoprotein N-acyltransferase